MAGRVRKSIASDHGSGRQLHDMASVPKKCERNDKSNNSSKGHSFVTVLNRDSLKQLEIPKDFSVKGKESLPSRLIIESTILKKCWRVEVEEDESGEIFLGEGWSSLVDAHSFVVGEILVFVYSEPSIFQVKIYGRNGCEKTTIDEASKDVSRHQKVEKTEMFDECKNRKGKDSGENLKRSKQQLITRKMPLKRHGHGIHKKQSVAVRSLKWTHERTCTVLISGNSIGFSVILNAQKTHQLFRMAVPKAVAVAKKLHNKKRVILQNVGGDRWQVTLTQRKDGRPMFTKGWRDFLRVNNIEGGDKIHFQFISDTVVQVRVTKTSQLRHHSEGVTPQDESSKLLNMKCDDDDDDDDDDDTTTSESPSSFSWKKTTNFGGAYLYVPRAIAESRKLVNRGSVVIRDPEGKCWPVELRTWPCLSGRVALSKGWCQFWQAHNIEAGDTVHFEFLSDNFIKVDITRGKSLEPAGEGGADKSEAMGNELTTMETENELCIEPVKLSQEADVK